MRKQSEQREYNFPDADLYMRCMECIQYAVRDIGHFVSYGYTADKVKSFKNLCLHFSELQGDDELVGAQMEATARKDDAAEHLRMSIRSLMTRVEQLYPSRSGKYRRFGTFKMNDMTDAQLLFCGRRVVRVATHLLGQLAEVGVRTDHIMRVRDAAERFENAMNFQQDRVSERDIATERRIELGNRMYRELVSLCNIGKDIWVDTNSAKYENYVLYDSNAEQKRVQQARRRVLPPDTRQPS